MRSAADPQTRPDPDAGQRARQAAPRLVSATEPPRTSLQRAASRQRAYERASWPEATPWRPVPLRVVTGPAPPDEAQPFSRRTLGPDALAWDPRPRPAALAPGPRQPFSRSTALRPDPRRVPAPVPVRPQRRRRPGIVLKTLAITLALALASIVLGPGPWQFAHGTRTYKHWSVKRMGSTGTSVMSVQYLLRARGYRLKVDGIYGPETTAQVRSFQSARGLKVDGVVGRQTWSALIVTQQRGLEGNAVKAIQREVTASGRPLLVDGVFGSRTDAGVRSYQRSRGLLVDGIVGPQTWHSLVGDGRR